MASPIPPPVIAQAVVVFAAVILFTGVLTIFGSVPTSDVPERPINAGNATVTPAPGGEPAATATPESGPDDSMAVTVTPAPEPDDSITATATPAPDDSITVTATPAPDDSITVTATPAPDVNDMISQPDMDVPSLPVNLSGSGPQSTGSFRLEPGTIAFDISNDAPGNIGVWLMYNGDERFERLLENGVIAEGPVIVEILTGGAYYLDVTADGEWQINVSQLPA